MTDRARRQPSGAAAGQGAAPRVTYCGNVHAAATLADWLDTLPRYAAKVARAVGGEQPFEIGVWWPAEVAHALAHDAAAQALARTVLARHGLTVGTVNAFPFAGFHDAVVKTAVYRPDWAAPARVAFTLDAARAVCALAPPGTEVAISTLPLGFGGGDLLAMRANLAHVARGLAALAETTGVRCVLALEPEPVCLLETVAEAITCVQAVRAEHGDDAALRVHLGVCVDLCHLAVVGEEPLGALQALRAAGVPVPKVQVSACLETRAAGGLDRLLAYDEARYLHQTVGVLVGGARVRALDLREVAARRAEFLAARRLRTHFHVPLFWDEAGDFGSTRAEVERFLTGVLPPLPLLEAETYTWHVLPGFTGGDDALVAGLVQELTFVHECLARGGSAA